MEPQSRVFKEPLLIFHSSLIHSYLQSYRPITVSTFRLNYYFHGLRTYGYHLVNVLLHSGVCVLVYFLGLHIFKGKKLLAAMSAALFATHPIHTDAIDSIVGRAEPLYGLFYLISFLSFTKGATKNSTHWGYVTLSMASYLLSSLSKEMGVTVLGLLVSWDLIYNYDVVNLVLVKRQFTKIFTSDKWRHFWKRLTCIFGCFALYMAHRIYFVGGIADINMEFTHNPIAATDNMLTRWLSITYLHSYYVWLLVYPVKLSVDYSFNCIPLVESLLDPRNAFTVLNYALLVFLSAWSIISRKYHKVLVFSIAWFVLPFLPSSQVFFYPGTLLAERTLYIPSIGFCLLVSFLLYFGKKKRFYSKKQMLFICFVAVLLYSDRTLTRNSDWNTPLALFGSGMDVCPTSTKVLFNYASRLEMAGRTEAAETLYKRAIQIDPKDAQALGRLGKIALKRGNYSLALRKYQGR